MVYPVSNVDQRSDLVIWVRLPVIVSFEMWWDCPKVGTLLSEYLGKHLGATGIPLAYVVRRDRVDENVIIDPAGEYSGAKQEMINRAPHVDAMGIALPTYLADRLKVWELLSDLCRDHDCWSYIKPAQRTNNGRVAFWKLYNHYLGPNNVDNRASASERLLQTTIYKNENKRWNFEKYVRVHVDQHAILTNLKDYGYSGIDERSKVRHLLEGIKSFSFDSVKATILSSTVLRNDFDGCVSLYTDFISQMQSVAPSELNISATRTDGNDDDGIIEDRYYDKQEYRKLTDEQKDYLRETRKTRGHVANARPNKRAKTSDKSEISKLNRQIAKLTSAMDKSGAMDAVESDADGSADEVVKTSENRNNPGLIRQKRKAN